MRGRFSLLLIASLVGLAASLWMTKSHFELVTKGFEGKSFCNVSEFIDCDTALASRYARIGNIPTSEFGILYYSLAIIGILLGWASREWRQPTLSFLFASSIFAVFYSAVMATLSIFRLGVICLLCLSTYTANLLFVFLLPGAIGIGLRSVPGYLWKYLRSIIGKGELRPHLFKHLIFTLLFFGIGLLFFRGLTPDVVKAYAAYSKVPKEFYLKNYYAQPVQVFNLPDRPSWGQSGAPVTIVEFSDFQCPFCRRAAFTLKPYLGEYRKEIRFVFVNYPLDSACNPAITRPMHPVSCLAAKGALCAFQMGKFWEFHDGVFENQKRLSRDTILEVAKTVGLDAEKFNSCLVSPEVESALKQDIELGNQVEVHGTPSIFINGRPFQDWTIPDRLRMVLESEIKK